MSAAEGPGAEHDDGVTVTRGGSGRRLGALVLAKLIDQGTLGLGSILLARALGPEAFAPVAVLFIVNSLTIQVADLGLGFAVLRTPAGSHVATRSLRSVRRIGLAVAAGALVAAAALLVVGHEDAAIVVLATGLIWGVAGEARVRKSAALTAGSIRQAAGAEVAGATFFAVGVIAAVVAGGPLVVVAGVLVAKHVVEIVTVRDWRSTFAGDGAPARSGPEWLGQVMTYLAANADYLVLGLLLTSGDLSRYAIAFRVASAIPALVGTPITQTAFLDMAGATGAARQSIHDAIRRRVLLLGLLGAGAVLVAAPLLRLALGEGWDGVGALVAVLAVAVPFRLLLGMSVAQAITVGRARDVVGWEAGRLVVLAVGASVGAVLGGVVWGTVAVSVGTVVTIAVAYVLSARSAGVHPWRWILAAGLVACTAAVVFGATLG